MCAANGSAAGAGWPSDGLAQRGGTWRPIINVRGLVDTSVWAEYELECLLLEQGRRSRRRKNLGSYLRDRRLTGHLEAMPGFDLTRTKRDEHHCGATITHGFSRLS